MESEKRIETNQILKSLSIRELLINIQEDWELSSSEMARKLGISRQQYNNIINENAPISVAKAAQFAAAVKHPEKLFVAAALDDLLERNKLKYKVLLEEN